MEDSLATWFVQQGLPRIKIPWFWWITETICWIYNKLQKSRTRTRLLVDSPKTCLSSPSCQRRSQAIDTWIQRQLWRLRCCMQKNQVYIWLTVTHSWDSHHKPIANRDQNALTEFYYTLSDCLVTLRKQNYASDLYSADILRQSCDHCLTLKRTCKPNLTHLGAWLQERILTFQKDQKIVLIHLTINRMVKTTITRWRKLMDRNSRK